MAAAEIQLLERVMFKLALAPNDDVLQANIATFLAPVLLKGASSNPQVRTKVMEILSHVNKMSKSRPQLQLPVDALLAQYADPNVSDAVKNFTKIYLASGWSRLPIKKQLELAPQLLSGLKGRPPSHIEALVLLLLPILGDIAPPVTTGSPETISSAYGLDYAPLRTVLFEIMFDVMLLANIERQQVLPVVQGSTLLPPPPPGLSRARLYRLVGKNGIKTPGLVGQSQLIAIKRGIIKFVSTYAKEDSMEGLACLLVGSGDGHHQVASDASTAVKRTLSKEDYNRADVVQSIYHVLLGTDTTATGVLPDDRRSPASVSMQMVLFGFLLRSTRAADTFPECLRAVALTTTAPPPTTAPTTDPVGSGVDGKSAALPLRLRVLGLQLVHRVCESASSANIATHGGTLLHSVVLKLLEDPTLPDELQTLAYSAIGKLSRRCPDLFHDNFDLLEQLFRKSTPGSTGASSSTPVRQHVRDALTMMRRCYVNPNRVVGAQMVKLLSEFVQLPSDPHARMLAVQYANAVFPKSHLPSRLVCLLAFSRGVAITALTLGDGEGRGSAGTVPSSNRSDVVVEADKGLRRSAPVDASHRGNDASSTDTDAAPPKDGTDVTMATVDTSAARASPTPAASTPETVAPGSTDAGADELPPFNALVAFMSRELRIGNGSVDDGDGDDTHAMPESTVTAGTALSAIPVASITRLPLGDTGYCRLLEYLRNVLGLSAGVGEDDVAYEQSASGATPHKRLVAVGEYLDAIAMDATMQGTPSPVMLYRNIIERALECPGVSTQLQQQGIECLVELVAAIPAALAPRYKTRLAWLQAFVFASSDATRENAARLTGYVAAELEAAEFTDLISSFSAVLLPSRKNRIEDKHGALLALGFTLASMFRLPEEWRPLADDAVRDAVTLLYDALVDKTDQIACAACVALGELGKSTPLPLPNGEIATKIAGTDAVGGPDVASDPTTASAPGTTETATSIHDATTTPTLTTLMVVDRLLRLSRRQRDSGASGGKGKTSKADQQQLKSAATKVNEAAITCLGLLGVGEFPHCFLEHIRDGLCRVAEIKSIEVQFSVGGALCSIGTGPLSLAARDKWFRPDARSTDGEDASPPKKSRLDTDNSDEALNAVLDHVLSKWARHPHAWSRQAASIWMVSILKHCGDFPAVVQRLKQVQQMFTNLLSEGDEFAQDVASKGLGLLYDLGDSTTKAELVQVLVSTFSEGSRSQTHKYTTSSEDEVQFGSMGADNRNGQGFSTYKELCSIASDLNQPDLIYKFMQLANHNTMWNSRKGAAFGFSSIAARAQQELQPHLPALVPRLYRYQFDPSPSVRSAMDNIFKILCPEVHKVTDKYVDEILADLLEHISNKQWRVRESSCSAISDILRGRRWQELKKYIVDLWQKLFRALDDVKESVRIAALSAAKRLAKTTITMCSSASKTTTKSAPAAVGVGSGAMGGGGGGGGVAARVDTQGAGQATSAAESTEIVAAVLPVLIESGLLSQVAELRGFSLGVMLEIAKDAGAALKPHLIEFMMVLLEALSGMENPALDYISNRMDATTRSQDVLDDLRVSSSRGGPIMECINSLIPHVDTTHLPDLVTRLCDVIKKGLGSSTKSGCAHVATQLAGRFRADLTPHASALLKALLKGAVSKSAPLRREFATAIGHVVRCASPKDVNMVVNRCRKYYKSHRDDEAYLEASAAICRGIAIRAPDVLRSVGSAVLPLAFLGMHDAQATTKSLWAEIWDDNTPGTEGGIKLYATEIIELATPMLEDRSWETKRQAAQCLAAVAETAYKGSLTKHIDGVITALLEGLKGRTWEGKDSLVKALALACVSCAEHLKQGSSTATTCTNQPTSVPDNGGVPDGNKNLALATQALLREASKTNKTLVEYRTLVLGHIGPFFKTFASDALFVELLDMLNPLLLPPALQREQTVGVLGEHANALGQLADGGSDSDDTDNSDTARDTQLRTAKRVQRENLQQAALTLLLEVLISTHLPVRISDTTVFLNPDAADAGSIDSVTDTAGNQSDNACSTADGPTSVAEESPSQGSMCAIDAVVRLWHTLAVGVRLSGGWKLKELACNSVFHVVDNILLRASINPTSTQGETSTAQTSTVHATATGAETNDNINSCADAEAASVNIVDPIDIKPNATSDAISGSALTGPTPGFECTVSCDAMCDMCSQLITAVDETQQAALRYAALRALERTLELVVCVCGPAPSLGNTGVGTTAQPPLNGTTNGGSEENLSSNADGDCVGPARVRKLGHAVEALGVRLRNDNDHRVCAVAVTLSDFARTHGLA